MITMETMLTMKQKPIWWTEISDNSAASFKSQQERLELPKILFRSTSNSPQPETENLCPKVF